MYDSTNRPRHGYWAGRHNQDTCDRLAMYPRDAHGQPYCGTCSRTVTPGALHEYDDAVVKDCCRSCAGELMAMLHP